MKPSLLTVCASSEIREVRRRVLQTRYQVTSICSVAEFEALSTDSAFSVLLICHSLRIAEYNVVNEAARARWPGIRTVALSTPFASPAMKGADAVVEALSGPTAMFAAIDQFLSPQRASAGWPT